MADIELLIEIDDKLYDRIKYLEPKTDTMLDKLMRSVQNGTPLPEGHGRLIILSEDAVKREQTPLSFSCQNWISEAGLSNATVAIIEVNGSEEKW